MVELLDLPDELILEIMNKVEAQVLLLCSIIGIGNNRLEQLALNKCHSIDLTFDYYNSSHQPFLKRFYSHVLPRIYNDIQSLVFPMQHLTRISNFAKTNSHGTFPNLKHLKIMIGKKCSRTGTPFILGYNTISDMHHRPLFSILPQLYDFQSTDRAQIIYAIRHSQIMRSIVSFELDEDCVLPKLVSDDDLFLSQSPHLTHIRVTLNDFDNCIRLLNQLGSQLHSFAVNITYTVIRERDTTSRMASISCPYLKELIIKCYRNIPQYEQCIVALLQRLSTIEYLTLLLAIGVGTSGPNYFIDGSNLQRDIISHMPHLHQFYFHIRSIVPHTPHTDIDTIRQSFVQQEQSVGCVLDYFKNNFGQCQIFSLPFIGTRLDFISNRFPLFEGSQKTFSNVTTIILFDDVKPFENTFFRLVSQALPRLKSLEVFNRLEQQETTTITTNLVEFSYVTTLILYDIHLDYAKQLLCRTHLPRLVELQIHCEPLTTIVTQHPEEARNNCSKIEFIRFVDSPPEPKDYLLSFFPNLH